MAGALLTLDGKLLQVNGGLTQDPRCCKCGGGVPLSPCCCNNGTEEWCIPQTINLSFERTVPWTGDGTGEDCGPAEHPTQSGQMYYFGLTPGDNYPEWRFDVSCRGGTDQYGFICYGITYDAINDWCSLSAAIWICDPDPDTYLVSDNFNPFNGEDFLVQISDSLIGSCCCIGDDYTLKISSGPLPPVVLAASDAPPPPYVSQPPATPVRQPTINVRIPEDPPASYYSPPGKWLRKQLIQMGFDRASGWCANDFKALDDLEPGWWRVPRNQEFVTDRILNVARRVKVAVDRDTIVRLVAAMAHRAQRFQ